MKTADSLMVIVEAGIQALRQYTSALESLNQGDRRIPPLLKAVVSEADVLSSALTRLAQDHVSKLPDANPSRTRLGTELAEQSLSHVCKVNALFANGLCEECGGVIQNPREGVVGLADLLSANTTDCKV